MKTYTFLLSLMFPLAVLSADPILPNPKLTPGDVVTNVTIEVIMTHGYTASLIDKDGHITKDKKKGTKVRNVSAKEDRAVFVRYGITRVPGRHEDDHLISLELGGSNSISNLWPQSYLTPKWNAHTKDRLENFMAKNVRKELEVNGHDAAVKLLKQYQTDIARNWTNAYVKLLGKP